MATVHPQSPAGPTTPLSQEEEERHRDAQEPDPPAVSGEPADAPTAGAEGGGGGGEIAALDKQLAVVGGGGGGGGEERRPAGAGAAGAGGGGKLVAEAMRKYAAPRSSRFHGVTRLKWSGKYEAHLWDNTSQVKGRKRKGKHAMGCSSSREAGGGVVSPPAVPAERRSRSLGMCRGGHDSVHAYTALPFEEPAKGARDPAAAEEALPGEDAATEEKRRHDAPSMALDLDPAVLPGFLQVLSQSHPALLYPEQENPAPQEACDDDVDMGTPAARDIREVTDFVRARVDDNEFHEKLEKKVAAVATEEAPDVVVEGDDVMATRRRLPRAGKPVVVYLTSLRSVRRTFEDCRALRAILRCYRVRLDERDVSMHAAFRSELRDLLGGDGGFEGPALPRVFVDGRHDLGGAEAVRALHEAGELARVLAGCEAARPAGGACAACGEARFVPCETCHGSCKVFVDDERCRLRLAAGFFRQCPDCNENGLIRCPVCCY